MGDFNEIVKELLIEVSGEKILPFSKRTGLDRTTIQRLINGQKLPGLDFMKKFSDSLRITPIQRVELLELYKREKMGRYAYLTQKNICSVLALFSLLSGKSELPGAYEENFPIEEDEGADTEEAEDTIIISSVSQVEQMISHLLRRESRRGQQGQLSFNLPFQYEFFFRLLYSTFCKEGNHFNIKHLLYLHTEPLSKMNSFHNLEYMYHMVKTAIEVGANYQPFFYYSNVLFTDFSISILPYYLITSDRVLLLSYNHDSAILFTRKGKYNLYKKKFDSLIQELPVFIRFLSNLTEVHEVIRKIVDQGISLTHSINGSLNSNAMLSSFHAGNFTTETKWFFYENGVRDALEIGDIAAMASHENEFHSTLGKKKAFAAVRARLYKEKNFYILRESFKIDKALNIEIYDKNLVFFYFANPQDPKCMLIDEPGICKIFYEFFETLYQTDFVFNEAESVKILSALLSS